MFSIPGLEFGLSSPLEVREERVDFIVRLRLLYISDLHLARRNCRQLEADLHRVLERAAPEITLLGGDLADDRGSFPVLGRLIKSALEYGPVGAVSGNHDHLVGRSRLRDYVLEQGGWWLEDEKRTYRQVDFLGKAHQFRGRPSILCSHYPTDFKAAREIGIPLVLAGHLHGWQIVWAQRGEYLYPGAWLSRWNGLRFERPESTLLVSRGVTDLFPLRWNCPREVLLVHCIDSQGAQAIADPGLGHQ